MTGTLKRRVRAPLLLWGVLATALVFSGCAGVTTPPGPTPARTRMVAKPVEFPARLVGSHLVVEIPVEQAGTARFIIDTGSSVTLLSPDFVTRLGTAAVRREAQRQVQVRAADGAYRSLPPVYVRRLTLGGVRFEQLQALLLDQAELSAHLGVAIDGILGFPLFQELQLTLDYPAARVVLAPAATATPVDGSSFAFSPADKVPLIPVQLNGRTVFALVDSGSDTTLNLNPSGLDPAFAFGPRPGASIASLSGERVPQIGRLASDLQLGNYRLVQPTVDLTEQLTSLGGGALKHFTVTFNQVQGTVTFFRESTAPIVTPPIRTVGLGFSRTPAYWRVASVIPDTPADRAGILPGDLVTRINGDSVERWDLVRYETLLRTATWVEFTFLNGREETTGRISVAEVVP